jgi:hypothetical protein
MVTVQRLRELFIYDPETGAVTRKRDGEVCGSRGGERYIRALVDGKMFYVHRIVFALHFGFMPDRVDHRDGDKRNNRPSNLRECTQAENTCNRGKTEAGFSSQFKGVHFEAQTQKWRAEIKKNGKQRKLGRFDTEEEAAEAYNEAAKVTHGEFAKLNDNIQA